MSWKKTWLVALLSAFVLFVVSDTLAVKPLEPSKDKKKEKAEKVVPAKPMGAAAQKTQEAPAPPAKSKKPEPVAATADKAGVLPRPIEPAKLKTKKDGKGQERLVITNDDLSRIYGRSDAKPESPEYTEFLGEVARQDKAQRKQANSSQGRTKSKAARKAELTAEIDRLKKKLLGLRNPLLPRGKSTEAEDKAQKGMDNVKRVKATQAEIARLEAQLARLK